MVGSATLVMVMSSTSISPVSAKTASTRPRARWLAAPEGPAGGRGLEAAGEVIVLPSPNCVIVSPICVTIARK
jgi:hypothetical protein